MWDELRDWARRDRGDRAPVAEDRKPSRAAPPARENPPIHVLMRYSDLLHSVDDTIHLHREVLDRHGAVWVGKLGKPLARSHIAQVESQVQRGIPTYLFLVQRTAGRYEVYRGTVVEMARALPAAEGHLVPEYYEALGILAQVGFWTKVCRIERLDPGCLDALRVSTSGSAVPYSLITSMAGMFIVEEGRGSGSI